MYLPNYLKKKTLTMFFKLYQYCFNLDNTQYFDLQPVKSPEADVYF